MKRSFWILSGLLALLAVWLLWPSGERPAAAKKTVAAPASSVAANAAVAVPVVTTNLAVASAVIGRSAASTNREFFRLSNTSKTLDELTTAPRAILLENALIDTASLVDLKIPAHLRATGEPGAYIVQARNLVDAPFRAALANAGAQIVSYIPNNAYLVQLSADGAARLRGNAEVAAVLPFEPYFKLQASLLGLAVAQKPLPPGQVLTLGLFDLSANQTLTQIENLGGVILASDRSPFGPIVRVRPPADWIALAQLPGVQRVEPATRRVVANDLARVTMGITTDYYATNANWRGLSGTNVVVEVNDTGIDASHPDFSTTGYAGAPGANPPTRVSGDTANSVVDTDGHGTHVAGIIAGNGGESYTVTSTPRGSVTNADFRGKAPAAKLFSVAFLGANDTNLNYTQPTLDSYLQEMPALTNALISNNSWINDGANEYDLSAASYDAAVRDALPGTTGPQPVLFVFAAGNDGGGGDNGVLGSSDTILSPGTAKNVVTVGALEQYRDITNIVTALDGTSNAIWEAETSSGSQVAGYSARGNVGVQTEGAYGRFKPDVVAPGTFVVSTRPTGSMWDQAAYYDPTNFDTAFSSYDLTVDTNTPAYGFANVPGNAVGVTIQVVPNNLSSTPFPTLPIYISATGIPDPNDNTTYDFVTSNNIISIPPDGGAGYLGTLLNGGFTCAVGAGTNLAAVNFDLIITLTTTNDNGNELTVLSNLNDTLGPYYRYETGTSMAAPAVSGALALLQDYFTNTLHSTPSPALLKAMVINGARLTSGYNFYGVTNSINYEGWGLVNVPNSVPLALTNAPGGTTPMYFLDQSPTNALATGDSRVFTVNVPTANAQAQQMHITLAWTDPPGNPAAGIKLVNNLDLVVTNNDSGEVFYGNDFISGQNPHSVASTATNGVADNINNVESVILQAGLGTNYSVAVIGHNVAVNAVTTEQTNIVQDFALVISCGDGSNTNGITVTPVAPTPLVIAPNVTYVVATNGVYYNQIAGASAPWLSTNAIMFGTNSDYTTNDNLYIGQTNQWHFFVVTNNTPYTNAAFIIFLPETLATPREGVFADSTANSTRPEADLDLFVAGLPQGGSPGDPNAAGLTNLDPTIISNCVYNVNGDQASLARGGTKFIVYTNASLGQVFYVGVQCQDQMAADFGFLPIFSQNAFSQLDSNGNEVVTGLLLPATIPDGSNPHPGLYFSLGLATIPMTVGGLTVSNTIATQNYGDLIGVLTHDSAFSTLNNHTGPTDPGTYTTVYNDDGMTNTTHTDGPGSLRDFRGDQAIGPWFLSEIDDATSATGAITSFTVVIQPHLDLTKGLQQVTVQPYSWYYGYVDVPVGYTNISVVATNLTPPFSPAIQLYLNYNVEPDFTTYLAEADLTNGPAQNGNSISYGPPMQPGRYFVGLYNPSGLAHTVLLGVTLAFNASAITTLDVASTNTPLPLKDDAVTYDSITVTNTDVIQDFNVGLRVDHPRISDLVFHLISPDGTRYLLMENRGGQSTNGCGITVVATNVFSATANGTAQPNTNVINTGTTSGILPITYNFYTAPDQMTIYYGPTVSATNLIYDTGPVSNPPIGGGGAQNTQPITINVPYGPTNGLTSTYLTIVMDEFLPTNRSSFWTYTAGGVVTNFYYLAFTEDTNLTTTPIKFATPPFTPYYSASNVWTDSFEAYAPGTYTPVSLPFGGWSVLTNQVEIATNLLAKYLQLNNGAVVMNLPTILGQKYLLTYQLGSKALGESNSVSTNANWTPIQVNFTATQASSPLVLDASGSGLEATLNSVVTSTFDTNALFDAFTLTQLPSDLYYQAEQDLSPLIGTSAKGTWTLEVLDNRAGATNFAPQLVSWNLEFQFANTNFTIPTVTFTNGNGPVTNFIPGGGIQWYLIDVPTNADFATNSLLFATLPLNFWFSTNAPPTTTNSPGDVLLLGNSTGNSVVLGTNGSPVNIPYSPAYIVPSGSYYLGVQNPNSAGANYAVNVTFHLLTFAPYVLTTGATNITTTAATLDALVNPGALATTLYFEYGLATNGLTNFSASISLTNNLNAANYFGIDVTNLTPGSVLYFQAVAANGLGTNYGGILAFTNLPANIIVTFGGLGDYRGVGIKYLNGSAYICGDSTLAGGLLADFTLPLVGAETPAWNTNWPSANPSDFLNGITANNNGIYSAGMNSTRTVDTAGGKEDKGLVVKFPLSGATGSGFNGDIWDQQTPAPPGAFSYGGSEGLNAVTLASENGNNYIYATGNGQSSGANGGRFFLSKLQEDSTVLWTVTDGAEQIGNQFSAGEALTVLNTNIYVAGQLNGQPYLRKYDPNGNLLWKVTDSSISGQYQGVANALDYIYAVGYANGSGTNTDFLIDKWDESGNLIWSRTYDRAPTQDQLNAAVNFNNRIFAVGFTYVQTAGGADAVVVEIDPLTGDLLSTNLFGGSLDDKANAVDTDNTNLYVVGETRSFDSGTNQIMLFTFTPVLPSLTTGMPTTNVVAAGGINWYQVNVPTNALAATNALLFATGGVNLWFSTNAPPSITNAAGGDFELLTNSTGGTNVIAIANTVPVLVPGGIYYLGVENTNSVPVTNALEVTFAYAPTPPVLPVIAGQVVIAGNTLVVTNTATDTNANAGVLAYYLTNSPASAYLTNDIYTNNIIIWPTTTNDVATNYVFTTVVTDTNTQLSATNSFLVTVLAPLLNGQPQTNVVGANSIVWYGINVPTNALAATNALLFATGGVNLWFSTNAPPSITNAAGGDFELLTNSTGGTNVIAIANTVPVLVPGGIYYLGVENTNSVPVTNSLEVTFLLTSNVPPVFSIFSIVNTNIGGTNGWLITWFAPTNYQFHLQWTPNLLASWHIFNGVISFLSPNSATNGLFQYFDNGERYYDNGSPVTGSPTDGFDPMRFYRLQLLNSPTNTPPYFLNVLSNMPPVYLNPAAAFTLTNNAADWDIPAQTLTYRITNSLVGTNGATINTNTGVIDWTPLPAQGGQTNIITTVVTDNGVPAKSTTNSFTIYVNLLPAFSSITVNASGVNLQWSAWTNEQFQVQWTTNLAPPNWMPFTDIITSTNGNFFFTDTNTSLAMKFYQLILLP